MFSTLSASLLEELEQRLKSDSIQVLQRDIVVVIELSKDIIQDHQLPAFDDGGESASQEESHLSRVST